MKVKKKIYELIEIGTKIAAGFLPNPFSAAFYAVYDNVKENVLNKRAEKWKEDVIIRLEKLEANYDDLINSEAFATALIKASELAVKTESDKKRQMLADTIINAYSQNIDEDRMIIFLNLMEKYTRFHIEIIRYLHNEYMKERYFNNNIPTFMAIFKMRFPKVENAYLKKAIKDLQNDYLVKEFRDDAQVEFRNKRFELLTVLGNDFYNYLKPVTKEN